MAKAFASATASEDLRHCSTSSNLLGRGREGVPNWLVMYARFQSDVAVGVVTDNFIAAVSLRQGHVYCRGLTAKL